MATARIPADPVQAERERQARRRATMERHKSAEGFTLPMPERLQRTRVAPEREILTARERLDIDARRRTKTRALKRFGATLLFFAALFAIVWCILLAFDDGPGPQAAPWGAANAPAVQPPPLSDQ